MEQLRHANAELHGWKNIKIYKALLHDQYSYNLIREVSHSGARALDHPQNYYFVEANFLHTWHADPRTRTNSPVYGPRVRFRALRIDDFTYKEPEFIVMPNLMEDMVIGRPITESYDNWFKANARKVVQPAKNV
jgi:hypothetical protein